MSLVFVSFLVDISEFTGISVLCHVICVLNSVRNIFVVKEKILGLIRILDLSVMSSSFFLKLSENKSVTKQTRKRVNQERIKKSVKK